MIPKKGFKPTQPGCFDAHCGIALQHAPNISKSQLFSQLQGTVAIRAPQGL